MSRMVAEMKFKNLNLQSIKAIFPNIIINKVTIPDKYLDFGMTVCPENVLRAAVVGEFSHFFAEAFTPLSTLKIAIVGGYENEPEIRALKLMGFHCNVDLYGIENDMYPMNLNVKPKISRSRLKSYDLVLCSQVWEHIWNHGNGFANLLLLMGNSSFLWLACPMSNRAHSSPYYYSAGFTKEYFEEHLQELSMEILASGQLGSPRYYRATHTLPIWLTVKGHSLPFLWAFKDRQRSSYLIHTFRYAIRLFELMFFSKKIGVDSKYASETWVCAKLSDRKLRK